MNVSLLTYTPEARELLLFSKQTRLSMDSGLMQEIRDWPEDRKQKELDYMLNTIESSWEFVDYTFSICDVSRAFTHQLVRTRDASYAQQSQRTVGMEDFMYVLPEAFLDPASSDNPADEQEINPLQTEYAKIMGAINHGYQRLRELGAAPQDARGVLPTNVATNIMIKANLATLSRMAEKRLCSRTQGEYQNIFRQMRLAIIAVHPWAAPFLRVACAKRGVCQFPNYKECPIKPGIFNPDNGLVWPEVGKEANDWQLPLTKTQIQERWEGMKYEAVPNSEMKR